MSTPFDFRKQLDELWENNKGSYILDSDLSEYTKTILAPNIERIPPLYRYVPADYYNIRCLETRSIFLSEIGRMNDIFEGLTGEIDDAVIKRIDKLSDAVYLKCFSENRESLLMWSTYADNYAGMCIEYDLRKLEDVYLCHLFPVRYSNIRNTKAAPYALIQDLEWMRRDIEDGNSPLDNDGVRDIVASFLTKSMEWKYEAEWRLIVTYLHLKLDVDWKTDNELESLYGINKQLIEFDHIRSVRLGPKMKRNIKDHIIEICRKLDIDVYETQISRDEYKLDEIKL